jgi:hypothetical protein
MSNLVKVIVWRDVLVLTDDGRSVAADYEEIAEIAFELQRSYPQGWGILTIIPDNAVPPSESVREAINRALKALSPTLTAATWVIEGVGFQSAMVRAVLGGLRFFTSASYARHVSSSLEESLRWLLTQLPGGERRLADYDEALQHIIVRREAMTRTHSGISTRREKVTSRAE